MVRESSVDDSRGSLSFCCGRGRPVDAYIQRNSIPAAQSSARLVAESDCGRMAGLVGCLAARVGRTAVHRGAVTRLPPRRVETATDCWVNLGLSVVERVPFAIARGGGNVACHRDQWVRSLSGGSSSCVSVTTSWSSLLSLRERSMSSFRDG